MRYPEFLHNNDTIGFVAPSFGCATEPYISLFNNAQENFKDLGYKLKLGPNSYADKGIGISNTPFLCGKELNETYADNDIKVILSCGGGELMCEVVPHIDFDLVKKSTPKWYMGYSDNTNFTFLSATIADTAAIYGPCATSFGMEPWHKSIQDALDLLTGKNLVSSGYDMWEGPALPSLDENDEPVFEDNDSVPRDELREQNPLESYHPNRKADYKYFLPSEDGKSMVPANNDDTITLEGRLIGGCLDCLINLRGTEFDHVEEFNERYKKDGIIWFLEACDLNVMSIRRAIWQMKYSGWFKYLKGFMVGRPYFFGNEMMGLDQYKAVTDILSEYKVPILMDLDIGHLPPMMPLITGAVAKVTATKNKISVEHILK